MVHIVQSWDKSNMDPKNPSANITIQVYSDAPAVELFENGNPVGKKELHSVAPLLLVATLGLLGAFRIPRATSQLSRTIAVGHRQHTILA